MNAGELESLYFHQFAVGCDCASCPSKMCARSRNFALRGKPDNDLREAAKICATNHEASPLLCQTTQFYLIYRDLLDRRASFKEFLNQYLGPEGCNVEEISTNLHSMFSSYPLFSILFPLGSDDLSFTHSSIDEELCLKFCTKISESVDLNNVILNYIAALAAALLRPPHPQTFAWLRSILILFYFPAVMTPKCSASLLLPLIFALSSLQSELRRSAISWLSSLPSLLKSILGAAHFAISTYYASNLHPNPHNSVISQILETISMLRDSSRRSPNPLPSYLFCNHHIDESIDPAEEFNRHARNDGTSLLCYSFILSLQKKSDICQIQSQNLMGTVALHSLLIDALDGGGSQSDFFFTVHIRRQSLLDDAITQLTSQPQLSLLKKLRVVFEGESAVDVGGPSREFIYLITEQLFSPDFGMFVIANDRYHWFSQFSFEDGRSYHLVGLVVGLAIYNHVLMPIRFPLVLYKKLLKWSLPLVLNDLKEIDPSIAQSLQNILEMAERSEDVSQMGLTFDATIECYGKLNTVQIAKGVPPGCEVNNQNCESYVSSYINWRLNSSVERQFVAFRKGFELVCRASMYYMLEPEELDIFVSGEEILDWGAFERMATYNGGYKKDSRAIKWFWDVFGKLSEKEKTKFLKFATGTDRAPLGGLGNVKLVIQKEGDVDHLPVSHTCFNIFCLPDYKSKKQLEEKLLLAIDDTEGFGTI